MLVYKKSIFYKCIASIKKNPLLYAKVVVIYLLLFQVFLLINKLTSYFVPSILDFVASKISFSSDLMIKTMLLAFYLIYFLIIILVYSLFTMVLFGYVKSFTDLHTHSVRLFRNMFVLNTALVLLFLIISIFIMPGLIWVMTTNPWIMALLVILTVGIFFLYYTFFNFSQILFLFDFNFSENIATSVKATFSKSYYGVIIFTGTMFASCFLLYLVLGIIFGSLLHIYDTFLTASSYLFLLILSMLLAFNNLYFYLITKHRVLKKK